MQQIEAPAITDRSPSGGSRPGPALPPGSVAPLRSRSRLARLLLGRPSDPAWSRPVLIGILAAAGLLYCWAPDHAGRGNTCYAAAA